MNDVTVVTSVTYPSPESLALVADVQYHEPYLSAALNRTFSCRPYDIIKRNVTRTNGYIINPITS
ncbi:hypothetical protein FYK19_25390 (plasmid) [Escherichia albertii]|nr:hypothetical protein FYK19_25390 [Escherichia albertii]